MFESKLFMNIDKTDGDWKRQDYIMSDDKLRSILEQWNKLEKDVRKEIFDVIENLVVFEYQEAFPNEWHLVLKINSLNGFVYNIEDIDEERIYLITDDDIKDQIEIEFYCTSNNTTYWGYVEDEINKEYVIRVTATETW